MKKAYLVPLLSAVLLPLLLVVTACPKKEEETVPPPPPTAEVTAVPSVEIVPEEDAGDDADDAGDADADAAKKPTGHWDPTGIGRCCAALQQNAASAPLQHKGAYLAAAGACQAIKNNPQGRAALAQVRALLRGANVPSSCR